MRNIPEPTKKVRPNGEPRVLYRHWRPGQRELGSRAVGLREMVEGSVNWLRAEGILDRWVVERR